MGASSSAVAHHTGPRDVTSPEYFPEVYPEQAALYRLRKRQAEAGNNENHAENAIEFDEEDEEMAQMAANLGLPRKNPKGQIINLCNEFAILWHDAGNSVDAVFRGATTDTINYRYKNIHIILEFKTRINFWQFDISAALLSVHNTAKVGRGLLFVMENKPNTSHMGQFHPFDNYTLQQYNQVRQTYKPNSSGIVPSGYFELDDARQITQCTTTFERPHVGKYLIIKIVCGQYSAHSQNQLRLGPMAITGVKWK